MVDGRVGGQSRWVIQALWLIAAALLATILIVRSKGILTEPQLLMAGIESDASPAFSLPATATATSYSLDVLTWAGHAPVPVKPGVRVAVVAGTVVTITGWAFDQGAAADYPAIGAQVSGSREIFSALLHLPRPDVATALRSSAAANSGFAVNINTSQLPLGRHVIVIRALSRSRDEAAPLEPVVTLDITNQSAALQHTDEIDSVNGVVVDAASSATSPVTVLKSYGRLSISGWGFVTQGRQFPSSVTLLVDGHPAAAARYGLSRPEVARTFHDVRMTRTGFDGTLQTDSLPPGMHDVQLGLTLSNGTTIPSASTLHINLR